MKMRNKRRNVFPTITYTVAAEWWAAMFRAPYRCKKVFKFEEEKQ